MPIFAMPSGQTIVCRAHSLPNVHMMANYGFQRKKEEVKELQNSWGRENRTEHASLRLVSYSHIP